MTSTSRTRARSNDDGLTLVEMVVSIGILMVVVLSSLGVFVTVKQAQQTSEGTDRAIQLATSRIERIRQLAWKDIGFYRDTFQTLPAGQATTDWGNQTVDDEPAVFLGNTDPNPVANRIKPYEVTTETGNNFQIFTTISYGFDENGPIYLPTSSESTPGDYYSFKRVRVTIIWTSNGSKTKHKTVNESWFAPQAFDELPPGVSDITP